MGETIIDIKGIPIPAINIHRSKANNKKTFHFICNEVNQRFKNLTGITCHDLNTTEKIHYHFGDLESHLSKHDKKKDAQASFIYHSKELNLWFKAQAISNGEDSFILYFFDISEEKKTIETLQRESEKKYRLLVENIFDIVYKINSFGEFTFVSPSWKKFLGHEPEEILGTTFNKVIHQDDIERCMKFLQEAFATGNRMEGIEYRVKSKNTGEWRWHTTTASPVVNQKGEVVEYIGTARDITDIKTARDQLLFSQKLYKESIDNSSDLIFVKDEKLRYIVANKALTSFFNKPRNEILGKTDIDLMGKETGTECYKTDRKAMIFDKPNVAEEIIGDQVFETIKFPIKLENGKTGLAGFIRDITEKRELTREIREKTRLLEHITDNMFDMVSLTDVHGNFLYATKSHQILGYCSEELLGKSIFELVHPEDQSLVLQKSLESLKQLKQEKIEYRIKCADGSYKWLETIGKILLDNNNQPQTLLFSSRDITQRKDLEDTLRKSEIYLGVMLDNPFESIWSVDRNYNLRYLNNYFKYAFERSFGISLKPGMNIKEQLPNEAMQKQWQKWYDRVLAGEKFVFEETYEMGETYVCAEIAAAPIYEGDTITGACFYGREITERKIAANKINYLIELQNLIMTIASDYINLDIDLVDKAVNESLESIGRFVKADRACIFEYNWEEGYARNAHEWCEKGISSEMNAFQKVPLEAIIEWAEAHKRQETVVIEKVDDQEKKKHTGLLLKLQHVKSLIAIPILSNGECTGFICFNWIQTHHGCSTEERKLLWVYSQIFINLKNRKELEENLIAEKENAYAANKAKSEFLANISHEIRTPMNSILGFSEVMLNTTRDAKQKNYLKTILDSGKTLLSLINDILDLSKIEAGRIEISPEPVDLRTIIHDIHQLFRHETEEKGLRFLVDVDKDFPQTIIFDEVRLRQILLNLTGNAIKFTHSGHIKINVYLLKDKNSTIDFAISVSDTGIGIKEVHKEQIFESFNQSSGQDTKKYGGTGLGLAISKRLIELMRGQIILDSKQGEGSAFTISFTDVKYSDEIQESNALYKWDEKAIKFERTSVMVVDDVPYNRQLVKSYLEEYDMTIYEVESGELALEAVNIYQPGIIFMDIRMPGMNGYEATEIIKKEKNLQNIPIIALTASTMQNETKQLMALFDGYLRKPVQKKSLINEMTKFLKFQHIEHDDQQTDISNKEADGLFSNIIDAEIAKAFNDRFRDEIRNQLDFVILENITQLSNQLDQFAIEKEITILKITIAQLKKAIEAYNLDKIQQYLEEIQDLFDPKTTDHEQ